MMIQSLQQSPTISNNLQPPTSEPTQTQSTVQPFVHLHLSYRGDTMPMQMYVPSFSSRSAQAPSLLLTIIITAAVSRYISLFRP